VLAFRVAEQLDVFEDIAPSFFVGSVGSSLGFLPLQQLKKALCHRVIVAISLTTHRVFQSVLS